jgi:hypothetical protein
MAAPNDPNDKPKVTLDLDLGQPSKPEPKPQPAPREPTQIKFRPLDATVQKPERPQAAPSSKPGRHHQHRTKAGKVKKTKNPSKPLFVAAGLLVVAVLGFQYFGDVDMPAMNTSSTPAPKMLAKKAKAVTTESLPRAAPPPATVIDSNAGLRAASLDQIAPEIDDKGNTFFSVKIIPKPVCYPGDVEAIRKVVGNSGSVLLSLEPMAEQGKAKPPITRMIALKDIIQGTKVSLPVNLKESGVYGIYICGDAAGKRSCGGKKAADFNEILNHRDLDVAANAVFFYQFAVLGMDYPTLYTGTETAVPQARQQLAAKNPKRDWKPELEKAAGLMRGVKSLPPNTVREGNAIVLELQLAMINPNGSCR